MRAGRVPWLSIGACLVLAAATGNGAAASADCLSYTGRVYLTGKLVRIVFPRPPNYDSIARGDRSEAYFIIRFTRPVCVSADIEVADISRKTASRVAGRRRPRTETRIEPSG